MNNYDHALNLFTDYCPYVDYTESPFRQGAYNYATDKVSLIQVSATLSEEEYEFSDKPNAELVINKKQNRDITITVGELKDLLNLIPKSKFEECDACDGRGQVDFSFEYGPDTYFHTAECPVCGGTGEKELLQEVRDFHYGVKFEADAYPIKQKYLVKLIQTMDLLGIKAARLVYADPQIFKFELGKDVAVIFCGYFPEKEFEDLFVCYKKDNSLF